MLASAVAAGLPVLATGGAALTLAEVLGGGATAGTAPQFGFIDVEALPAAKADPLLAQAGNGLPLLHWHDAGLVLPPGAELLLRCERLRPQAFRHGRSYALLAHLEATGEVIRRWAADLGRRRNNPAFAIRLSGELDRHQARAERFAASLAQGWAAQLKEVPR
jgi:GMP synthase-like glutamine amidotransferase